VQDGVSPMESSFLNMKVGVNSSWTISSTNHSASVRTQLGDLKELGYVNQTHLIESEGMEP
ncbi:hypothetical protein KI387_017751, partial [Taxus chinensis]